MEVEQALIALFYIEILQTANQRIENVHHTQFWNNLNLHRVIKSVVHILYSQ